MSRPMAQLKLAREIANLAAHHAPECPTEAARLLHQAAWIFREAGAEAAAKACAQSARELRARTRQPRSRPFRAGGGGAVSLPGTLPCATCGEDAPGPMHAACPNCGADPAGKTAKCPHCDGIGECEMQVKVPAFYGLRVSRLPWLTETVACGHCTAGQVEAPFLFERVLAAGDSWAVAEAREGLARRAAQGGER